MQIDSNRTILKSNDVKNKAVQTTNKIATLAASLMKDDWRFLALFYPLIVLPSLALVYFRDLGTEYLWQNLLLSRIFGLLFLWIASLRVLKKLGSGKINYQTSFAMIMIFGLFQWALYAAPLRTLIPNPEVDSKSLSSLFPFLMFISVPLVYFSIRLFLFALPSTLTKELSLRGFINTFKTTWNLTSSDPLLPLKILVAPTAISALLSSLPFIASPDGREVWVLYLSAALDGTMWLTATYLSIAAGTELLPEKDWRSAELDPYRTERLTTVSLNSPPWLSSLLKPVTGFKLLITAILIWTSNLISLQSMKPSPDISFISAMASEKTLVLTLQLKDPEFKFNNFSPSLLRLAGETGSIISAGPLLVTQESDSKDLSVSLPKELSSIRLKVTFSVDRSAEKLVKLEDLFLYYRAYKVIPIKLSETNIKPSIVLPQALESSLDTAASTRSSPLFQFSHKEYPLVHESVPDQSLT
ncbi:MAG: hypothetical protein SGJ02_04680 [bacterium]|nr:hypothetical protein [bacterium]